MNVSEPLLVGIDAGTTQVRALIFTATGQLVAQGSTPTPTQRPRPGWAEYHPDELWLALVTALRQALQQVDDVTAIVGISVASVGEAAVPLDAQGKPTAAAIAWFDERSKTQAQWLEAKLGQQRIFELTGLHLDPMFGLCKLLWLRENQPEAYQRTTSWLNIADYLTWRLCGEVATDYSLASRTLALDLKSLTWSQELLEIVDVPVSLFQPLRASGSRLGTITSAAAQETGLSKDCVVAVGGHDHIVGALAVGAWRIGTLLDSMGTAEALLFAQDQPLFDPALIERGFSQGVLMVEQPHHYVVGAMTTSGACVEWYRQTIAANASHDELIAQAENIPAGSRGVHFFPQMRVGTPPLNEAYARGAFFGLSPDTQTAQMYRALLEGLAYDANNAVSSLTEITGITAVERILAIGGDSRNRLLMQIKAAVHQQPITIIEVSEAVSLGAALLGGLAAGVYDNIEQALTGLELSQHIIEPDAALVEAYQKHAQSYQQIPALLNSLHQLIR